MLQVKERKRKKDLRLREQSKRYELVKSALYSLDNRVHIIDNENKYLYDMVVSLDDVEFGVSVRSGNFEKTKGYIEYKEKLNKFIDRLTMPIIIFYVNKRNKDVFISAIVNYDRGELIVKDKIVKRTLTQGSMDNIKDEINMNRI
ncbi:MAG TPA: hypothetical protein GX731_00225, partial [Clostridiales bacterium]|nr:hypothetical protein [Clostridiales bacterium]